MPLKQRKFEVTLVDKATGKTMYTWAVKAKPKASRMYRLTNDALLAADAVRMEKDLFEQVLEFKWKEIKK